jgi:hypothetical protein
LLLRVGVKIEQRSPLSVALVDAYCIAEVAARAASSNYAPEFRPAIANAVSILDLASKLVRLEDHPSFHALLPHLQLLGSGAFSQAEASRFSADDANKLFEFHVALMVMDECETVELDSPTRSRGNNPDILTTHGGRKWGIACKALYSDSFQALIQRVEEGISQVERSQAEIGLLIFSLKNLIDHGVFWPVPGTVELGGAGNTGFLPTIHSGSALREQVTSYMDQARNYFDQEIPHRALVDLFLGKRCRPQIGFPVVTAGVAISGGRVVIEGNSLLEFMGFFRDPEPQYVIEFCKMMDRGFRRPPRFT